VNGTQRVFATGGNGGAGGAGGNGAGAIPGLATDGGDGGNGGAGGTLSLGGSSLVIPPSFLNANVNGGSAGVGGAAGTGGSNSPSPGTSGVDGANGSILVYDDGEDEEEPQTAMDSGEYEPVAFVQPMINVDARMVPASNVLLAPTERTAHAIAGGARVEVARGAAAFVLNSRSQVTVLVLHEAASGDVLVRVGATKFALRSGEQLVMSSRANEFAEANPLPEVAVRNVVAHKLPNGVNAWVSDYSLPSAIMKLPSLRKLSHSSVAHHRALYGKMLKNAAASLTVTAAKGIYRAAR
jgi:hypothetical protein